MATDDPEEARIEQQGESLTADERQDIDEHRKLRPLAVYEVIRREGIEELSRPTPSLWWSGLAAGLSIGFSVVTEGALHASLPDTAWRPLVENWGYAVGFLMVILGRQQLFTEITLTAVLPVLQAPSWNKVIALVRLWSVVFFANMIGTAMFAAALTADVLLPDNITRGVTATSRHLAEFTPGEAFWRAIVSGWMIAMLVWMLPSAETGKIWIIALMTYLIALFDLSHVVAGSVEVFYLVLRGELAAPAALGGFILPMLAGNVIGGSALFAILAYGQVRDEID